MGQMEIPDNGGRYKRPDERELSQPNEEEYLHRHCDSTSVFWQGGVAHCISCGQPYPPYEPVVLYMGQEFTITTYYCTPEGKQLVLFTPIKQTDPEVSVEEAEAIGKALLAVPHIRVN